MQIIRASHSCARLGQGSLAGFLFVPPATSACVVASAAHCKGVTLRGAIAQSTSAGVGRAVRLRAHGSANTPASRPALGGGQTCAGANRRARWQAPVACEVAAAAAAAQWQRVRSSFRASAASSRGAREWAGRRQHSLATGQPAPGAKKYNRSMELDDSKGAPETRLSAAHLHFTPSRSRAGASQIPRGTPNARRPRPRHTCSRRARRAGPAVGDRANGNQPAWSAGEKTVGHGQCKGGRGQPRNISV